VARSITWPNFPADIKEVSRRTKLFGGEKEPLLQVIVNVGTFYSLTVPVERRAEVDALVAELEKARDRDRRSRSVGIRVQGQAEKEVGHAQQRVQ
jgi:hypothetical protein